MCDAWAIQGDCAPVGENCCTSLHGGYDPGLPSFPSHFLSLRVPTLLVTSLAKFLYFWIPYVRCTGSPYTFIVLGIILHAPGYLESAL